MWILNSNKEWEEYNSKEFKVYVILHGFNGNLQLLENLFGKQNVESIFLPEYDIYPKGWKEGNTNWMDDDINTQVKNLATLVDNIIIKKFESMIIDSNGPSLVVTGSRGGQVTLSRLWKFWRGSSICLNAGCVIQNKIEAINLGLITGGKDFFACKDLSNTLNKFKNKTDKLVIYHNTNDDHSVASYDEGMIHVINKLFHTTYDANLSYSASIISL